MFLKVKWRVRIICTNKNGCSAFPKFCLNTMKQPSNLQIYNKRSLVSIHTAAVPSVCTWKWKDPGASCFIIKPIELLVLIKGCVTGYHVIINVHYCHYRSSDLCCESPGVKLIINQRK